MGVDGCSAGCLQLYSLFFAMPPKVNFKDVSPFLRGVRSFLLGRKHTSALRQTENMACRSQPLPSLPPGVSHGLSANYYYTRDGRRAVEPELTVAVNSSTAPTRLISAGEESESAVAVAEKKAKTPGAFYNYGSGYP